MRKSISLYLLLIAIIATSLSGCGNKRVSPKPVAKQPSASTIIETYLPITVPNWLLSPPAGTNWGLGFSKTTRDIDLTRNAARQYAAVFQCRNQKGAAIFKQLFVHMADEEVASDIIKTFDVIFCDDMNLLDQIDTSMALADSTILFREEYIGLFSSGNLSLDSTPVTITNGDRPNWFNLDPKVTKQKTVYTYGLAKHRKLEQAMTDAVDQARTNLARYMGITVKAGSWRVDQLVRTLMENESEQTLLNTRINRLHLARGSICNQPMWHVWVELEMK